MTAGISGNIAIDTSHMTGFTLEDYKKDIKKGLKGDDKEFYQKLKNQDVERSFAAFDTDGNGILSGEEAIGVSSVGFNQRKFSQALNGGGLDAYIQKMYNNMGSLDTSSLSSLLDTSTGAAASVSGTSSSAAVNFALKYSGKSASEMSSLMGSTGFHSGKWCADFVYYCLSNAGLVPEGYDSINHAYCPSIAQWARQNGRAFSDPSQAKPGDLLIMNSEGHIGIVTKVDSDGIHTIEGNTSNASGTYDSPGGGGWVCEKVRDFSAVSTFVRI